jgi:hypothetical protein
MSAAQHVRIHVVFSASIPETYKGICDNAVTRRRRVDILEPDGNAPGGAMKISASSLFYHHFARGGTNHREFLDSGLRGPAAAAARCGKAASDRVWGRHAGAPQESLGMSKSVSGPNVSSVSTHPRS